MEDDSRAPACDVPREMEFLLFNTAGVHMAVDTDQVEGIIGSEQAGERAISGGALSGLLGMGPAAMAVRSKVILFRDGDETYGIGIDGIDSIIPLKIDDIQTLPELLSSMAGLRPFWGVFPRGDSVVLLIDLFRLKGLISLRSEITKSEDEKHAHSR